MPIPLDAARSQIDAHAAGLQHGGLALARRAQLRPDAREQILNAVWGFDFDPGTKVLEVYIGYLRRKLGDDDGDGPIETVRNAGYRLRAPRG